MEVLNSERDIDAAMSEAAWPYPKVDVRYLLPGVCIALPAFKPSAFVHP